MELQFNTNRYKKFLLHFFSLKNHCHFDFYYPIKKRKRKKDSNLFLLQGSDKLKDTECPKQDLKSRGLCLVPISSTIPVANETTADFWTPTFGGTFR